MRYYWKYKQENDVKQIIISASQIAKNSYINRYKYVLPYVPNSLASYSVYVPDIDYSSIKNFWIFSENYRFPKTEIPQEFSYKIRDLIGKSGIQPVKKSRIQAMKKQLEDKIESFEDFIFKVFRRQVVPDKIVVLPTLYGAITNSYSEESCIFIFARQDSTSEDIFKEILLAIINKLNMNEDIVNVNIAEFLTSKARLNEILIKNQNTLKESSSSKLQKDSSNFLKKLGFYSTNSFDVYNDTISHSNSGIKMKDFTKNEKKLFSILNNNFGDIVTYEEIGDTLYEDNFDNKFSLYYISRLVSDIREKLRKNGINNQVIHTKRGAGYMIS